MVISTLSEEEKNKLRLKKRNDTQLKYYHNNKDKINEKINCPICGKLSNKRTLKNHQKSKKCQNFNEVN